MTNQPEIPDIRSLSYSGMASGAIPVQEFIGTLAELKSEWRQERDRAVVVMNFSDVEVIRTAEPWPYPTVTIVMNFSARRNSSLGILAKSIDTVYTKMAEAQGGEFSPGSITLGQMEGKRLHMDRTPGHRFGTDDEGKPIVVDCWELQEVVGESTGAEPHNAFARALEILNESTQQEFQRLAMADPVVRTDPALVSQILGNTFLTALVAADPPAAYMDDDGIYHVPSLEE